MAQTNAKILTLITDYNFQMIITKHKTCETLSDYLHTLKELEAEVFGNYHYIQKKIASNERIYGLTLTKHYYYENNKTPSADSLLQSLKCL